MRQITLLLVVCLLFTAGARAGAFLFVPSVQATAATPQAQQAVAGTPTTDAFLEMTPAKFKEMTGRKMTLKERITLKVAQKSLKKQLKSKQSIDTSDRRQMLRLWLIFLALAIGFSILGWFLPFLWILSGIAGLAALIFFIFWIIAVTG